MRQKYIITISSIFSLVGLGCSSAPNLDNIPIEVTGTIRSSLENFSFSTNSSSESHWINDFNQHSGEYYARNWQLVDDIHQRLLERESELRKQKLPMPIIYICISGNAIIKAYDEGTGHLSGWKSDITFTEIKSAREGSCEETSKSL